MQENWNDKKLVRGFKWYHWLFVLLAGLNGSVFNPSLVGPTANIGAFIGGAIGAIVLVAIGRVVWHELRPMNRKDVEDAKG